MKRKVKGDKLWVAGRSCTGWSAERQAVLVKRLGPTQSPLAGFWAESDTSHSVLSTLLTLVLNQLLLDCQLSQRSSLVNWVEVHNYQSKLNIYCYHSSDKQAICLLAHYAFPRSIFIGIAANYQYWGFGEISSYTTTIQTISAKFQNHPHSVYVSGHVSSRSAVTEELYFKCSVLTWPDVLAYDLQDL